MLNHLHVMALETFVLLKVGRTDALTRIGTDYETSYPPPYKRAWEIVKRERHGAFISELKGLARTAR